MVSGLFQGSVCLPYTVIVQAHNSFGFTEVRTSIPSVPEKQNGRINNLNILIYKKLLVS